MLIELFRFLHLIGIAFGLGGATIASIISIKSEKNPELNPAAMQIIPSLSKLIWFGLLLLIISGVALPFLIKLPINKQTLLIKHLLVVLIIIIGITISIKSKKLIILAPKPKEKPLLQFIKAKKQLKFLGITNLILWYLVTLLSVFL